MCFFYIYDISYRTASWFSEEVFVVTRFCEISDLPESDNEKFTIILYSKRQRMQYIRFENTHVNVSLAYL